MNKLLSRLSEMGQKESRMILGLMSGTSLDGLDIALCLIKGSGFKTSVELIHFDSIPYSEEFKLEIRTIFSKKLVDLEKLTLLNARIALTHAETINSCLKKWNIESSDIDCIASHGQTIYHAPQRLHGLASYPNATLQIGDGDHLAIKTQIITLSDFRQKHVAAGGEGAPLALYGDSILFSSDIENRFLLNIGGISNFTFLPAGKNVKNIICTDTGPGNTLIDALAKKYFSLPFDKNGDLAKSGTINHQLLNELLTHSFFQESLPKTTGPELFNLDFLENALNSTSSQKLSPEDLIATVTQFTAASIALGIKSVAVNSSAVYISGGGSHNSFLIEKLQDLLPSNEIKHTETLGIHPDAKEAILFAVLANETLCGSAIETGAGPAIMMGKISLPG